MNLPVATGRHFALAWLMPLMLAAGLAVSAWAAGVVMLATQVLLVLAEKGARLGAIAAGCAGHALAPVGAAPACAAATGGAGFCAVHPVYAVG